MCRLVIKADNLDVNIDKDEMDNNDNYEVDNCYCINQLKTLLFADCEKKIFLFPKFWHASFTAVRSSFNISLPNCLPVLLLLELLCA